MPQGQQPGPSTIRIPSLCQGLGQGTSPGLQKDTEASRVSHLPRSQKENTLCRSTRACTYLSIHTSQQGDPRVAVSETLMGTAAGEGRASAHCPSAPSGWQVSLPGPWFWRMTEGGSLSGSLKGQFRKKLLCGCPFSPLRNQASQAPQAQRTWPD